MASLRLEGVSLSFDGHVRLFDGLDLSFGPGWTGLVGANGGGKTTLLRLASGELRPDGGRVSRTPDDARVRWCRQSVEAPDDGVEAFARADDGLSRQLRGRLRLRDGDLARWTTLSPGERRRWQVGAALAEEPDVLLLDEPTNHLDGDARGLLVEALQAFGGTGVVVSHDRELLDRLTTRTVRVRDGGVDVKPLPWSLARAAWELEERAALDARRERQDELRRLERRLADARRDRDAAQASRRASGRMRNRYDSDARSMGAQVRADWAEAGAGRRVAVVRDATARARDEVPRFVDDVSVGRALLVSGTPAPRPVLATLDLPSLEAGGRTLAREVRLAWRRDDRVALTGPNGAGKSTLVARLLDAARLPPERLLHLPQDLDAAEAGAALRRLRAAPAPVRGRTLQLVAALGVDPERLLATSAPSHGESRKLLLALGLARDVWAVVLDEPANHLDLPSVERLEAALAGFGGALLVVTHDPVFAARVARDEWSISGGRVGTRRLAH